MKNTFQVVLFYKYVQILDPESLQKEQKALCERLQLKGRMIIAQEGINGTFEGTKDAISLYVDAMKASTLFKDVHFKISTGTGNAFPRLSIKIRPEIVATHLQAGIDPMHAGTYLTVEELHTWFQTNREFYIVDMRNDFEQSVGIFKNSIKSGMSNFRDLPVALQTLSHLKDKTILTVCTGGVRCEKASAFLLKHGFSDVYQLYGGIVTYMEKYPGEDFLGSLYVFDNRLIMGFNMDDPQREIIGRCVMCNRQSEHFINCKDGFCHRHFICCETCRKGKETIRCPMGCRDYSSEHPELQGKNIQVL